MTDELHIPIIINDEAATVKVPSLVQDAFEDWLVDNNDSLNRALAPFGYTTADFDMPELRETLYLDTLEVKVEPFRERYRRHLERASARRAEQSNS